MKDEFTLKVIDKTEEICNEFCDGLIVPMIKTTKQIVLDSEYLKPILTLRNSFVKNKIDLFFQHLNKSKEEEKINFIKDLNPNEKVFFAETINKIIDLDDNLQNYIMSCLVDKYKKNNELTYYEKKLYYNINSLSEDDFKIYFCIYNRHLDLKKGLGYETFPKIRVDRMYINKNIIYTSLLRFSSIGILLLKSQSERQNSVVKYNGEGMKIETTEYFEITEYSEELFNYLKIYFKDDDCKTLLQTKEIEPGIRFL